MRMCLLLLMVLTLGLWACSEQPEPAAPAAAEAARATETDHAGPNHAAADEEPATGADAESDADATAKADTEADDAAAPVCVVSGETLGSMGDPVEVTVEGQTVKLCCPMCEAKLREDPDKYLARLDQAQAGTLDVNADESDDDHDSHAH